MSDSTTTYAQAGVNIDAGNQLVERIKPLARATLRAGADTELGGFGGLFDLKAAGFSDPVLVAANDGVGTKLKVAIEANIHNTVGIDLVAMCVNDLIVQGAEPLFFLDYFASASLDLETATNVIAGISQGCQQANCALIGGETAEMPGMYAAGDYDLAGFSVGAVERGKLLPTSDLADGDVILGLASSGLHSNGFSLVRHIIEKTGINYTDAAPFNSDLALGKALLEPTRIYVKPVIDALKQEGKIKAIAHITGGGLIENLPRVLPKDFVADIDLGSFALPPVFKWLSQAGNVVEHEMLRTFNCGIGMVVCCAAQEAAKLSAIFESHGETVYRIGTLRHDSDSEQGAQVCFSAELGF